MDVSWRPYEPGADSTVVGDLRVSDPIESDRLDVARELTAALPPGYDDPANANDHYPVVLLHDGQNLFDDPRSYSGEWNADGAVSELAETDDRPVIAVGIPNDGDQRFPEYSPWPRDETDGDLGEAFAGRADDYLAWLVETVKPVIADAFRTSDDPADWGLVGSSMGGLVSLYGLLEHPETFGFAGVMSPAFWWTEDRISDDVDSRDDELPVGRIYMDVGTNEIPDDPEQSDVYLSDARRMADLLREHGYGEDDLWFVVDEGARHHEDAWRRRLPDALRWLLGNEN